jgi:hypothetical protein
MICQHDIGVKLSETVLKRLRTKMMRPGRERKKPAGGFTPLRGLGKVLAPRAGLEPAT